MTCPRCESTRAPYQAFIPFKNPRAKSIYDPQWAFHLKNICSDCHQFIAFAKQTPELMEELKGQVFIKLDTSLRPL